MKIVKAYCMNCPYKSGCFGYCKDVTDYINDKLMDANNYKENSKHE